MVRELAALAVGDRLRWGKGHQKWTVVQTFPPSSGYPNGAVALRGDRTWASTAGGRTQTRVVEVGGEDWNRLTIIGTNARKD